MSDRVRTPIGEMWLTDDGVLVHRIDQDFTITKEHAAVIQDIVRELTEGRQVPAVIDIRAVGYADREARKLFGASTEETSESATALIVGSGTSHTMAKAFLAMEPSRPIEAFTSEKRAMDWARSQVDS